MTIFRLIVPVCLYMCSMSSLQADDWALYRGNAGAAGYVADTKHKIEKLKIVWEHRLEKGFYQAAPIAVGNTVFIGNSDTGMEALDLATGKTKWTFQNKESDFTEIAAAAAYFDRRVFVGDTNGILHALDAETGKEHWAFDTKGTIDNSPNIDVQTKRVLIGSQFGTLFALDAATGKPAWEYKTEDQIRCFPSIVGRYCFVAGCDSHLHVIDLDSGKGVHQIPLDSPTGSTPLLQENVAFVGTEGNEFLAVDWKQEKIIWRCLLKQSVRAPAAYGKGIIVFGGMDKTVYAIDAATGKERWQFKTKGRIEGGAVIAGDRVLVPSGDSTLYLFDLVSGKQIEALELPGKLLTSSAVVADQIILATDEGVVICLQAGKN